MIQLGSRKENIVAKIFGGADQLTLGNIGQKNIVTAEKLLQRESIHIVARSTGQTILGSCVAVCLFDHVYGYGAINHFMLPWWNGQNIPSPKYGDIAVLGLIKSTRQPIKSW
jgi:chemotaxis receptor (MCP) glutamine deamidase CheD